MARPSRGGEFAHQYKRGTTWVLVTVRREQRMRELGRAARAARVARPEALRWTWVRSGKSPPYHHPTGTNLCRDGENALRSCAGCQYRPMGASPIVTKTASWRDDEPKGHHASRPRRALIATRERRLTRRRDYHSKLRTTTRPGELPPKFLNRSRPGPPSTKPLRICEFFVSILNSSSPLPKFTAA